MNYRKIIDLLLEDESSLVRSSAAVIMGAMESPDTASGKALMQAMKDSESEVRLQAIIGLGKIRYEGALDALLEKFPQGGREGEEAANSIAKMGAKGVKTLLAELPKVSPGLRRYIGAAVAKACHASADQAAIELLTDSDPGMVEGTASAIAASMETRSASQVKSIAKVVGELAKKPGISRATNQAVTRLLSTMDDPSGSKALWDRIGPNHPPEVRASALSSLGKNNIASTAENIRKLVQCAGAGDFRIAAPALLLLQKLKADSKTFKEWLPLFHTPDPAGRHLALEKLCQQPDSEIAGLIAQQTRHPDRVLREAACALAAKSKPGQKALIESLLGEKNYDYSWNLARLLAGFIQEFGKWWHGSILKQLHDLIETGDRNADPLLFLMRESDAAVLNDALREKAQELRKKKKYQEASAYLKILTRDAGCPLDTKLELGCCLLKLSSRELGADARHGDPALHILLSLAHRDDFPLFETLKKQSWLDLECLFYVGFHFAEQDAKARKIAFELLEHVAKKAGRNKLGQAAKQKIKTNHLGE